VIGNPVSHSKSPQIHAAFARQTGQDITYDRLLAPLDAFEATVRQFFQEGGQGLNVTVPFKQSALHLVQTAGDALDAEAVNTIKSEGGKLVGYNTDGIGLVTDIEQNLGVSIAGNRVLLVGAGGATRGVMFPLLRKNPRQLVVVNRTQDKADNLVQKMKAWRIERRLEGIVTILDAVPFPDLKNHQFDIVINATSAGLSGDELPLEVCVFAPKALAYDMVYGRDTPFLALARKHGARAVDGLGMLVEQAAESFFIWRGLRPQTAPVIAQLRSEH
jgi:shikimate dehydrogenase